MGMWGWEAGFSVWDFLESWSGLPFPYGGDLPNPGIEPASPAWQADSLLLSHLGSCFQGTVLRKSHDKNWEIGTDVYILFRLCVKQITNKNRLYSTGNSLLSVLWWLKWEGNPNMREYMHTYG